MNEDPQLVGEAFRAGASAFLLKQSAAFELTEAVEKVLKGSSYVTPRAAKGQANIFLRGRLHNVSKFLYCVPTARCHRAPKSRSIWPR